MCIYVRASCGTLSTWNTQLSLYTISSKHFCMVVGLITATQYCQMANPSLMMIEDELQER